MEEPENLCVPQTAKYQEHWKLFTGSMWKTDNPEYTLDTGKQLYFVSEFGRAHIEMLCQCE